jgi:hypothetical protein
MTRLSGSFNGSANWVTTVPQKDVPGHEVTIMEITGTQSSQDALWNNSRITYWGVGDTIAGNGTQRGCYVNQHIEGDSDRGFFEARITAKGNEMFLEGTWTLTGGTGRFEGATGGGTFRSRAISPSEVECSWEGQYQTGATTRGAGR